MRLDGAVPVRGPGYSASSDGRSASPDLALGILGDLCSSLGAARAAVLASGDATRRRSGVRLTRTGQPLRCLGERGFALLTGRWRALQHITASPSKISDVARAALVLTHFEYGYIT